jgi:ComF family protein
MTYFLKIKMSKTLKFFKALEETALDIILPKKCFNCQKEGTFLCSECLSLIKINSFQVCPVCQKSLTEFGEVCRYCKQLKPSLDSLTTATNFDEPLISKLVHSFKYRFIDELSNPLSALLIKTYKKNKLAIPDLIIPVPLHPLRLRWRGFNQAELLAQNLSQNLLPGFPIQVNTEILTRIKFTNAQANLKKTEDRQKNVSDAFFLNLNYSDQTGLTNLSKVREKTEQRTELTELVSGVSRGGFDKKICQMRNSSQIKNKRILLVDDICTTGSTLFECGKQLRKLKPKSIHALVIARQK